MYENDKICIIILLVFIFFKYIRVLVIDYKVILPILCYYYDSLHNVL